MASMISREASTEFGGREPISLPTTRIDLARAAPRAPKRVRFTLRTLFIGITLVAVILTCWLGYRRATLCRLQWIPPGSAAAKSLFPVPTIHKLDDGSYSFTYY